MSDEEQILAGRIFRYVNESVFPHLETQRAWPKWNLSKMVRGYSVHVCEVKSANNVMSFFDSPRPRMYKLDRCPPSPTLKV